MVEQRQDGSWVSQTAGSLAQALGLFKGVDGNIGNEVEKAKQEMDGITTSFTNAVQLVQDSVADAKLYIAESGSFFHQNFWIPVASFFQEMLGMETAQEKLDQAKEIVREAQEEIGSLQSAHADDLKDSRNSDVLGNSQLEIDGAVSKAVTRAEDALPVHENRGALGSLYSTSANRAPVSVVPTVTTPAPAIVAPAPRLDIDNF